MNLMTDVLLQHLDKCVIVFIDDILIYFRRKEKNYNILRIVSVSPGNISCLLS